jgi:hypothetical protein
MARLSAILAWLEEMQYDAGIDAAPGTKAKTGSHRAAERSDL